jgi:hypothetical protein
MLFFLNIGTYRIMLYKAREVGLRMAPRKDGRIHMEECWRPSVCSSIAFSEFIFFPLDNISKLLENFL